jgi:hypothetical protein
MLDLLRLLLTFSVFLFFIYFVGKFLFPEWRDFSPFSFDFFMYVTTIVVGVQIVANMSYPSVDFI